MDEELEDDISSLRVPEADDGVRADKVLAHRHPKLSRSLLQRAFDAGQVWVEGQEISKNRVLRAGDVLQYVLPEPPPSSVDPVAMPLDVLYEDDEMVAINKAAGIVVHPGSGTGTTLVQGVLHHCGGKLSRMAGALRPGIVHRLDKDTTGLILFAKTDAAYTGLVKAFSERLLSKQYLALVDGVPELHSGCITLGIERHPTIRVKMTATDRGGKPARTDWSIEDRYGKAASLLRCWLHTGRTHQIRVHLSAVGHPILGDRTYGWKPDPAAAQAPARVLLHAERLELTHPVSGKPLVLTAPLHADFTAHQRWLRQEFSRNAKPKISS